jgi:hypothetical protein
MIKTVLDAAQEPFDIDAVIRTLDFIGESATQAALTHRKTATRYAKSLRGTPEAVNLHRAAYDLHAAIEHAYVHLFRALGAAKDTRDFTEQLLAADCELPLTTERQRIIRAKKLALREDSLRVSDDGCGDGGIKK